MAVHCLFTTVSWISRAVPRQLGSRPWGEARPWGTEEWCRTGHAPAPRAWRASSNTDQKTSNHRTLSRGHSRPLPAPITSPNLLMRCLPAPGAWLLGNQCSRAGGKNAGLGPRRLGSGPGFPGLGGLRYKTRNGLGLSFLRTSQVGSQPPREQQEGKTLAVLNKTTPYCFILFF